jgi:hypothetical protein
VEVEDDEALDIRASRLAVDEGAFEMLKFLGYWISLPPNADGTPGPEFPAVQVGEDRTVPVTLRDGRTIPTTRAAMISKRENLQGETFWTPSDENKKFTAPRYEFIEGLDDLSDAELADKVRGSIRDLQARTAQNRSVGATSTAAVDLSALSAVPAGE